MKMQARVAWLTSSEGGRTALPDGLRYITIGKFPDEGPEWPNGAWSVVLNFATPPSVQGNPSFGEASFLMDTAPPNRLFVGQRFELFEGLKKVAVVDVLGDS